MPFITEELYQAYFRQFEKIKSVHISHWPEPMEKLDFNQEEQTEFAQALLAIDEIRAYKSSQQLSQGKEIELFETQTPLSKNMINFVKSVGKVKNINLKIA